MNQVASGLNRITALSLSNPRQGLEVFAAITTPTESDRIGVGYCYIALQQYEAALNVFLTGAEDGAVGITVSLRLQEKYSAALEQLQAVNIAHCSAFGRVMHARERGILMRHSHRLRLAEMQLSSAAEQAQHHHLEPLLAGICTELAFVQLSLARPRAALQTIELALQHALADRRVHALYIKAIALKDAKLYAAALNTLDDIRLFVPEYGQQRLNALYAEASVYAAIGSTAKAVKAFQALLERKEINQSHEFHALCNLIALPSDAINKQQWYAQAKKIATDELDAAHLQLASAHVNHAYGYKNAAFCAERAAEMFEAIEQPRYAAKAIEVAQSMQVPYARLSDYLMFDLNLRSKYEFDATPIKPDKPDISIPPKGDYKARASDVSLYELVTAKDYEAAWTEFARVPSRQIDPLDTAAAAVALARLAPMQTDAANAFNYAAQLAARAVRVSQAPLVKAAYTEVQRLNSIYKGIAVSFTQRYPIKPIIANDPIAVNLQRFGMTTRLTLEYPNTLENLEIALNGPQAEYTLESATCSRETTHLELSKTSNYSQRTVRFQGVTLPQFTRYFT